MRRLYDIANVLVSMGLIAKDSYINTSGGYHKPGFYWVGPDITDVSHIRELGGRERVMDCMYPVELMYLHITLNTVSITVMC